MAAAAAHEGCIYVVVNLSPQTKAGDCHAEVERCVDELGFRALKLYPLGHRVSIASPDARIVFYTAAELWVPILTHTGMGVPHALPARPRAAKAFPDLPILLCRAGWSVFTEEAIVAAEVADNLLLEPSWCGPY